MYGAEIHFPPDKLSKRIRGTAAQAGPTKPTAVADEARLALQKPDNDPELNATRAAPLKYAREVWYRSAGPEARCDEDALS